MPNLRLRVERMADERHSVSIQGEWQALHESIEPRNPFGAPLWNMYWWKHYSRKHLGVANEYFLHTVRDEWGALRAVAPWVINYRPAFGPFRLQILTTFGADPSLTEIRGVICRRDDETQVIAALDQYLQQLGRPFDAVEWAGVRSYEALDILEAEGQLCFAQINPVYVLALTKTWEQMHGALSKKWRKYLRQSEEKLAALGRKIELQVVAEPGEVAAHMERFFKLHAVRANAKNMLAHPDKFANGVNRSFIYEIFCAMAARREILIFEARIGDDVVACRLAFVLGSTIYLYYSGYDPQWRDYNVGNLMTVRIIQWAMQNNFKAINLSAGKDRSKLQWRPKEFIIQGGVRIKSGVRGNVLSRYYIEVNKLRMRRRSIAQ